MHRLVHLTRKEKFILWCIAQGKDTRSIAAECCLSEKTIENHRCNIKKKLGLSDERFALVTYALAVKSIVEKLHSYQYSATKNEG